MSSTSIAIASIRTAAEPVTIEDIGREIVRCGPRSTKAVRWLALAKVHVSNLPAAPLPRTRFSYFSPLDILEPLEKQFAVVLCLFSETYLSDFFTSGKSIGGRAT